MKIRGWIFIFMGGVTLDMDNYYEKTFKHTDIDAHGDKLPTG